MELYIIFINFFRHVLKRKAILNYIKDTNFKLTGINHSRVCFTIIRKK